MSARYFQPVNFTGASSTPMQMVVLSAVIAVAAVVIGLSASLYQDLPAGPAIVVAAALGFFITRLSSLRA